MLRPFPQFSPFGPVWNGNPDSFSDFGTNSYNALQATVNRNMKNGLYLFAYLRLEQGDGRGGRHGAVLRAKRAFGL